MCFHIKFSFHLCIVALIFYCVSFVLKFNVLYLQALPHVARLFKPAVACPTCNYANDHTFKFCQQCGYVRRIVPCTLKDSVSFDLLSIDNRLDQLQQQRLSSAYSKQKQSLKQEFESFLFSLPARKTLFDALPLDVCRFLVFKDSGAKTQPHKNGCQYLGKRGLQSCGCPRRLAYGTVDSYIGKLRSILSEAGHQGDWNRSLLLGNPATDDRVKAYLKQVTAEQLQARVTPKQATPLFPDKLLSLSRHLDQRLVLPHLSPTEIFIIARDQAYFKCLFYSGDRAGDLGQVKTAEIARFPDDNGFLFNHIWGKTLRNGATNLFGMRRHPNPSLCPVTAVETYMAVCREIGIDLTKGYLFRPITPRGEVIDRPFASSAAEARFKLLLREAKLDAGETLHSFRAGCALTLTLSGSPLADVMAHIGWSAPATAQYYLKLSNVIRAGAPPDLLSQESPGSSLVFEKYTDFNHLKNFVLAFPAATTTPTH